MAAMPPDAMSGMDADMMGAMPPDAMAGAYGDMLEALPPGALEGMDMSMITSIPLEAVESVDWGSVPPEAMDAGFTAFQDGLANGMSPADAFEAGGAAADPYMPPDMGDMTADMMNDMPPEAMQGMNADE